MSEPAWIQDANTAASISLVTHVVATGETQPRDHLGVPAVGSREERKPWPALEQW